MHALVRFAPLALFAFTAGCYTGLPGACLFEDKPCCAEDEYQDENGDCFPKPAEPLENPEGEFGFSVSLDGAAPFEGQELLVRVEKSQVVWCGAATVTDGAAGLSTDEALLAGGVHYEVRWKIGDDPAARWSRWFEASENGRSALPLDVTAPANDDLWFLNGCP